MKATQLASAIAIIFINYQNLKSGSGATATQLLSSLSLPLSLYFISIGLEISNLLRSGFKIDK